MWLTNAKKADRKWNTCSMTDAAERALFLFLWTLIVRGCAGSMPCFTIVVRNESRVRWIVRLTLSKSDFVGVYYFIQKNTPQQQSLFQYNDTATDSSRLSVWDLLPACFLALLQGTLHSENDHLYMNYSACVRLTWWKNFFFSLSCLHCEQKNPKPENSCWLEVNRGHV